MSGTSIVSDCIDSSRPELLSNPAGFKNTSKSLDGEVLKGKFSNTRNTNENKQTKDGKSVLRQRNAAREQNWYPNPRYGYEGCRCRSWQRCDVHGLCNCSEYWPTTSSCPDCKTFASLAAYFIKREDDAAKKKEAREDSFNVISREGEITTDLLACGDVEANPGPTPMQKLVMLLLGVTRIRAVIMTNTTTPTSTYSRTVTPTQTGTVTITRSAIPQLCWTELLSLAPRDNMTSHDILWTANDAGTLTIQVSYSCYNMDTQFGRLWWGLQHVEKTGVSAPLTDGATQSGYFYASVCALPGDTPYAYVNPSPTVMSLEIEDGDGLGYGRSSLVGGDVNVIVSVTACFRTTGNQKVDVEHIAQLKNPLWTTDVDPGAPPMLKERHERVPVLIDQNSNFAADLKKAKLHNKTQHALNGNTSIVSIDSFEEGGVIYPSWLQEPVPERKPVGWQHSNSNVKTAENPFEFVTKNEVPDVMSGYLKPSTAFGYTVEFILNGVVDKRDVNPFSILSWVPEDEGMDEVPVLEERRPRTEGPRQGKKEQDDEGKKDRRTSKKAEDKPSLVQDPAAKRIQRTAVLSRIVTKIKASDAIDNELVGYLLRVGPKREFARDVVSGVWGDNWYVGNKWQTWFVSHYLMSKPKTVMTFTALINGCEHKNLANLTNTVGWADWFADRFNTQWVDSVAALEAEAVARNREMHAYNGNPVFSGGMSEVKSATAYPELYKTTLVSKNPEPWVTALELSTVHSSINPVDQDIPNSQPLRGDVVGANNVIDPGVQIFSHEALLQPRGVRNGVGAATIASGNNLAIMNVGVMSYEGSELADSTLMVSIMEAAIKANQNLGRADNVTLGGFQAFDVAFIGRLKSYYGLSMQSCLMKLQALALIANFASPRQYLPLSGEAGLYDPFTQVAPAGAVNLNYNDSPILGEDCGGNTAVLPWRGGLTGTVTFHLTLETVPSAERALAVFLPANLCVSDSQEGLSISLFVAMWADFPTVMHTVTLPTLDTAGGNPEDQIYIPNLSAILIPGMTSIHVILPRRTTVKNPTGQQEANTSVLVRPVCGPVAANGLAANALLDVAFVAAGGAGVTQYNLAEYLYTWTDSWDSTSIAQYLQRLNDLVDIKAEVKHTFEKLATVAVRYPPLVSQAAAGNARLAVNSASGWTQTTSLGVAATPVANNWPQQTIPRPDTLIFETDIVAWNKTVLGVVVVDGRAGTGAPLSRMLAQPHALYWLKLLARQQAAATNVHLSILGWSGDTWDTAYTNTDMNSFRTLSRAHYAAAINGNLAARPAPMGSRIARLFTGLMGVSPTTDLAGNTVFDYVTPPRITRVNVYDAAGVALGNCVPVFLPDVWIHQTCRSMPKSLCSYPPQNNQDSTTGIVPDGYTTLIVAGGFYGPMLNMHTPKNALSQNDTRDDQDEEIWNARLVRTLLPAAVMRDFAGQLIPDSPIAGETPKAQFMTADYTVPNYTTGVRSSSTFWIPRVLSDGRLQYPVEVRANMFNAGRVQTGISRAAIEIWAINGLLPSGDMKLGLDTQSKSQWLQMLNSEPVKMSQGGSQPESESAADSGASSTQ